MHALLPAKVTRLPAKVLAAAAAVPVIAAVLGLGPAGPAQAGTGTVSVAIDGMSPQVAKPGTTVTVTGTVSNGTGAAKAGLEVQLYTSSVPFPTRDQMDAYLRRGGNPALEPAGTLLIGSSLKAGAASRWKISFRAGAAGMTRFGVYPVTAQVVDLAGDFLDSDRTLLPFWPGAGAAGLLRPLDIAWAWPLIDRPRHQACSALTDDDLAASLSPGGRLSVLLRAGQAHPDAGLTWFIDPALLGDAAAMTRPYQVGTKTNCANGPARPASKAATAWLSALRGVLGSASPEQTVITPYANVDVTALVHRGLSADLASAYAAGGAVAREVLHGTFRPSIAWPAGGTANLSVLTSLAAREHVGTAVLSSSQMKPADPAVFHPDDAVTTIRTGAGTTMNVLLADDTLTAMLRAGNAGSPSAEFAVKQRFLAETAMIAAEAPHSARSIVVAPPQNWSPTAELAGDLLGETARTPWLAPATLAGLTTAQDTGRAISRQPPPSSKASPGELSRGYLSRVRSVGAALGVYQSLLYRPPASYRAWLNQALAATESSAWRGSGAAQGAARTEALRQYLQKAEKKVKIIVLAQVAMGGASGAVPVSIQNGLPHQAIQVRLHTSVVITPDRTSQLTIGRYQSLVTIQPKQAVRVQLPVSSAPQGSTQIELTLSTATGKPLPSAHASLTVVSTRYGRAILFLIGAAIGVLVLTSVYRAVRRWLHDGHGDAHAAAGEGSVVTGTSGAQHPTEAPDDLADARRWADDA